MDKNGDEDGDENELEDEYGAALEDKYRAAVQKLSIWATKVIVHEDSGLGSEESANN